MANLTKEQLQQLAALKPWESGASMNGRTYQPVYASAGGEGGDNPAAMRQAGNLEQFIGYDPKNTKVGDLYSMFDGAGKYTGEGQIKKENAGSLFATFLLTALTMGMGLSALMGGATPGAGAAAGLGTLPGAGAA